LKVSVIIAVYKNIEALKLIICNLKKQIYRNFEVIIAEDGNDSDMLKYVTSIEGLEVKHTIQEDKGLRKARSQNNGILAADGEYLIFIDGDCIPYTTFIDGHVKLVEEKTVLSGRRVNLNEKVTQKIFSNHLISLDVEKNYLIQFDLMFDKSVKYEQGIYVSPNSLFYKKILNKKNRNIEILGCNFSCFRKDFVAINGFDEGYGGSALSDDTDLTWRFKAYGATLKSCKNAANVFHLFHKMHNRGNPSKEIALMKKNQQANRFVCEKGLNTH